MSQGVAATAATSPLVIGRYALFDQLAAGGMATVHLGRLLGPVGFGRTVAVKRLHSHYLKDQEFITMFMDEARIVARIRHPNVVPMVDVVQGEHGLFLVMEYVHGESLSRLVRTARKSKEPIDPRIIASIMSGVLLGLHAAHETKGPDGTLLGVVHRDVSPQNVIVGADGTARVLDFGIAKAAGRAQVTREGQIKGKLAYMAPEQIRGQVDRRADVFAAAVVLWEMLTGRRLHEGAKDVDIVSRVVRGTFQPPSELRPGLDPAIDELVLRGLAADPKRRFASARELALELERKVGLASPTEVSAWVERLAHDVLTARGNLVTAMELAASDLIAFDSNPPPPSLSLPMQVVPTPPPIGLLPVDVEPAPAHGEPPSSSAVFVHGQNHAGATLTAEDRAARMRMVLVTVAISATLALIGIVLGAYALLHRGRSNPDVSSQPSASLSSPRTELPPNGALSVASAASATPDVELDETPAPSAAPSGGSAPSASAGASPRSPALLPPPGTAKKPAGKPACDPPYTLDDVGHRHYKPECMGLE